MDKRKAKKELSKKICFAAFAAVFLLSAVMLIRNMVNAEHEAEAFKELAALAATPAAESEQAKPISFQPVPEEEPKPVLSQYAQLHSMNADMFGWLKVEGTQIDYPVMFTEDDPEYYLRRAFDKTDSSSGCLFIGEGYVSGNPNMIIYGHHMGSGAMFGELEKYEDPSFYALHPTFTFNTLFEENEYEVISAFRTRIYPDAEKDVFKYYEYGNIHSREEFEEYVSACKELSAYDAGVSASWGDELVTLSTCAYHTSDGRFVVVARKIIR